jgi:murein DD-endopeptidase MepM/ murein hydrolase activator NlpD
MKFRFLYLFMIILLMLSTPFQAVRGQSSYPFYEIQPGDSLGYIADLFGTTIDEIAQLNNIANIDLISPGEIILIPSYPGQQGLLTIKSTDLGETYSSLPVKYQIAPDSVQRFNSILSPASIYAGSELILLIPSDHVELVPVEIISREHLILDSAAHLGVNPQTLLLLNHFSSASELLPGSVIFLPENPERQPLDLFSPQLGQVSLSPLPLIQGGSEVISVLSNQDVEISGFIGDLPLHFFNAETGQYISLQGVHALQEPGLVEFSLTATDHAGNTKTFSQSVLVEPGNFDEDPALKVDPSTIDPSVTGPENELVATLVSNITSTKYWEGVFISPAYYQEYNSLFGTRRRYNDDPTIYFHTGVDFAGGMTLPINAPAPGRVVFAGPLTVRGNAVFIDHGWGVFSGFFHQDTIIVEVGDFVEAGQQIGTVGNTGRVNGAGDYVGAGAHLHWELWVNGIQVNPLDWLYQEYP